MRTPEIRVESFPPYGAREGWLYSVELVDDEGAVVEITYTADHAEAVAKMYRFVLDAMAALERLRNLE